MGKVAEWVKLFATKSDCLNLALGTHTMDGEK